jgi:hypothetical protein
MASPFARSNSAWGKKGEPNKERRVVMAVIVAGEQYYDLDGQLGEMKRQIRQRNGYPYDPKGLERHLQAGIEGRFIAPPVLRRLTDKQFIIDSTDGLEILADAGDVFVSIDPELCDRKLNHPSEPTKRTPVDVLTIVQPSNFFQIFGSLSLDAQKFCFTQAQIKGFAKKYRQWLRNPPNCYGENFLAFECREKIFVAQIYVNVNKDLVIIRRPFGDISTWGVEDKIHKDRVVVPQLVV